MTSSYTHANLSADAATAGARPARFRTGSRPNGFSFNRRSRPPSWRHDDRSWLRRRFPGWGWLLLCATLLLSVVVVVVRAEGVSSTQAELDDGVVWVTNQDLGLVGRLNVDIDEIDTAVLGARLGLDVVQFERDVFIAGEAGGVQRVDVLNGAASGNNSVPFALYQLAGGVGVVYEEASGRLWTGPSARVVGGVFPEEPDALLEPGTKVVLTAAVPQPLIPGVNDDVSQRSDRGRVLALTTEGWREVPLGPDFRPVSAEADPEYAPVTTLLPPTTVPGGPEVTVPPEEVLQMPVVPAGVSPSQAVELTAVGEVPVVLNDDAEVVVSADRAVSVESDVVRLQQVGESSEWVYVATDRALVRVGLGENTKTEVIARGEGSEALGVPSQPVRVGRCVYGAWSASVSSYARWCDGDDPVAPLPIPQAQPDAELVWRVNQLNVVLNSPGNGDSWADHDGALAYVGNWSDVDPERDVDEVAESVGESQFVMERRCTNDYSSTPIAGDDAVGVRRRQSMLELLVNDDDLDCEPFRIASVTPASGDFGALTVVDSGQRVLWTPSDEYAEGPQTGFGFEYELVDAAGHVSSPAKVSVAIAAEGANNPPALIQLSAQRSREMVSVVEEGQAIKYDVLEDWYDPDGDPLEVTEVNAVGQGEVSVDRNNVLTFAAHGATPGVTRVEVTVSDGRESITREWTVTISPRGSELPPDARDDFLTVGVGSTAVIAPLDNDADPNEDELSLQPTWQDIEGLQAFVANDEVSISPQQPGLYRLDYVANDGSSSGGGEASILVTAVDAEAANSAPVAVPDEVDIRPGRVVDIDVTGNDVDIDGDVLSVVDVTAPEGIRASIIDRHLLQIEIPEGEVIDPSESAVTESAATEQAPAGADAANGDGTEQFFVSYRIVDGHESARASTDDAQAVELRSTGVLAVGAIPPSEDSPPVVESDRLVVRSGQVGAVDVLANDQDPDADELVLDSLDEARVAELEAAGQAVVWFDGRYVYAYGVQPGDYSVAYTVIANGRSVSSEVTIRVTAPAGAGRPNQAPELPHHLVRAVRGGTVRVQLPLSGSDPDGDQVELSGGFGATEAGVNAVTTDPDEPGIVLFSADPVSPGNDRFTYSVRDRLGAEATGAVDVVVVDDGGWAPQGHDDIIVAQPGRQVLVDALGNDTSPQDRELSFTSPPFFDLDGARSATPLNGGAVRLMDQSDPDLEGLVAVDVPTDRSTLVERYSLTDGVSSSTALIRVTPDPDAPNLGPWVADDVVSTEDLADPTPGAEVAVDVTENDFDRDHVDQPDALTVTVPEYQDARVEANQVIITVGTTAQTVVYRATDADGASAVGLIEVVGVGEGESSNRPPQLSALGRDETARVIPADSDESLTVRIADVVTDPDGDAVSLTDRAPRLVGGDAELSSDASSFTITPPASRLASSVVAVELEVTDRPDLSRQERAEPTCACVSTVVVRSLVESDNEIRIVSPGTLEVPQYDEPTSYDIEDLTEFDGEAPLTYELDAVPAGFDVELSGTTLDIVSTEPREVGEKVTVSYVVDAETAEPVTNTVDIVVVGTNRPEPTVGQVGPFDAVRGEQLTLPNLVDAAFSPFPDEPLTLEDAVATGGNISCSPSGDCTFESGVEVGQMSITYTLSDPLGRTVRGSFEIVVKGAPLASPPPAVESVGDRQVTLSWTQPDLQGGRLETYRVMVVETGDITEFGSTGGTITGLENDNIYTFIVQAVNDIGEGEWSEPSSGAVPDRAPDPPRNPTIDDYADATLSIRWDPPNTTDQYSAIIAYQVRVAPGGQVFTIDDADVTNLTIGASGEGKALTNGQMYTFEVRARNSADENNGWGEWSGLSGAEKPSRFPDPPTDVLAINSGSADSPAITVTWTAPSFDGGRDLDYYRVCAQQSGGSPTCQTPTARAANRVVFAGLGRDTEWTVTVVAHNTDKNKNDSKVATSPPVRVVGDPDPPEIGRISTFDKGLTLSASARNGSGCADARLEYSLDGSSWQTSNVFRGLTNGTTYQPYARMRLGDGCGTSGVQYVSESVRFDAAVPYGALPTLSLDGRRKWAGVGGERIVWTLVVDRYDDGFGGRLSISSSSDCDFDELPTENSRESFSDNGTKYNALFPPKRYCHVTITAPDGRKVTKSAEENT